MKAQEVKYLREDNAVAKQFFKLLGPAAREAMTVEDISVLVGLAAEVRERHSIPAAVHDAQQAAIAAAEEVSRRLAQLLAFKDWDDVGIGVLKEDAEEEWKVLFNALAQLRAVKETE